MIAPRSPIVLLSLVLAAVFGAPSFLAAQDCQTIDPPCPQDREPNIVFQPAGGTFTTSLVGVTIFFYDDYGVDWASVTISPAGVFSANSGRTVSSGSYSGTLQLQAGAPVTVTASVRARSGEIVSASETYSYSAPPPPPAPQVAPTLSLAPYNGDHRDPTRCVAGCFEQTISHATPAYVSLDVPRSVTLIYSAATVLPEATVVLDAKDASPTPPDKMSLKLQRPNGSLVPLGGVAGNPTEVFFAQGANGPSRLGARFNTGSAATSDSLYTAVVSSYWGSSTVLTTTIPLRVPIVREMASPYGAGWTIAGLQRIHIQGTDVVLTSGAGAVAFFGGCMTAGVVCTSPPGDFTTLTRRADNSGWDRRWPDGTTAAFDATGRITSIADRYSTGTTFAYNGASQQLVSITDPVGQVTALGYDANGKLDYMRDPIGRVTQVTINAAGDLVEIYNPDGVRALLVTYNGAHVPLSVVDRLGGQTGFARDFTGKLSQVQLPTVTANGEPVRPTLSFRSIDRVVLLDGSGPGTFGTPATRRVPDQLRATITAPNGDSTLFAFDRFGQATQVEFQNPQGQWRVNLADYAPTGQPVSVTTAEKGSTAFTWSGPDLASVRDGNTGSETSFGHEPTYHQVTTVSVNGSLVQQNFYGALGRLDSTKVGTSKTVYTSDGRGRVLTVTDPLGHQTSVAYDATGMQNTRTVTAPDANGVNRTTTFGYDATGRMQSVTDPTGRVVTTAYDVLNRVTSATGPLNTTTAFGYDDITRTYTVTDATGQVYQATQNALGWVETQTDPRGAVERFAYDVSGNVVSYTNRRGGVVSSTYDALNRPLTVTAGAQTTTFSYDPVGYWVAVANPESVDTVKSDAKGRVSEAISHRGSIRYLLQPTYTLEGQRNLLTIIAPTWSRTIGYGYEALFRLNYLRNQGGQAASLTYTAEHLPETVTLPITVSGTTKLRENFTYTPAHLLQALTYNVGAVNNAVGRRYTYDALGRVATVTRGRRSDGISATQNEVRRTIGYDALGRLRHYDDVNYWEEDGGVVCPDPFDLHSCYREIIPHGDLLRQQDFAYDSVGNRRDLGAVIETGNRLTAFNGYALGYDADGNLISKTKTGFTQTLSWNSRGQLTQVVTNGVTTTFGYDGFGRRVRKTTGATTTRYVWDGDDLVMELDGAGNPVREYSYYPGIDLPFAMRRSSDGALFYYSQEVPGHLAGVISTANQVVNTYEYDPWGQPLSTTEGVVQPLKYAGREYDSETGFYYVRARYYDPQVGRFISEDPIGLAGGINLYVYVQDDPVNGRDPSGLCGAGEELWIIFYDNDGDGHFSHGDDVITYYCAAGTEGGGEGVEPGEKSERVAPNACPQPPKAPPQADLNRDILKGQMFRLASQLFYRDVLFATAVWDGGVMDYKTSGSAYDPYGNFTYGAVGSAADYSENTLMRMAGWAHYRFDLGLPARVVPALTQNPPPYWDNAKDRGNITAGIQYYDNKCYDRGNANH